MNNHVRMCLAVPGKIVSQEGEEAIIDFGGVKRSANVSLLPKANIGDYVLVHVGFAIQIVDKKTAEAANTLIAEFE